MRKLTPILVSLALVVAGWVLLSGTAAAGSDKFCDLADQCGTKFYDTYIKPVVLALSGLVGVVAVISIIMAGIQYAGSADDPGIVSKAKTRVFNTLIGIVAYIFLLAFLNYLVPGGIL